jgi:hypothetical protein
MCCDVVKISLILNLLYSVTLYLFSWIFSWLLGISIQIKRWKKLYFFLKTHLRSGMMTVNEVKLSSPSLTWECCLPVLELEYLLHLLLWQCFFDGGWCRNLIVCSQCGLVFLNPMQGFCLNLGNWIYSISGGGVFYWLRAGSPAEFRFGFQSDPQQFSSVSCIIKWANNRPYLNTLVLRGFMRGYKDLARIWKVVSHWCHCCCYYYFITTIKFK